MKDEAIVYVVPAAPGTRAVIIGICPDLNGRRPTGLDVGGGEYPVVAWRVLEEFAVPVLACDVSDDNHCFVIEPDGSLLAAHPYQEHLGFENLDVAKACILAFAQHDWDLKRRLAIN